MARIVSEIHGQDSSFDRLFSRDRSQPKYKTLPMKFKIKCGIARASDAEWATTLQYTFQINPFNINRVFTMMMYTNTYRRDTPKHSPERVAIARLLRQRHRDCWRRYKEALEVPE